MSDIVNFERPDPARGPSKKAQTLQDHFGSDDWILKMCAEWRAARAQQQKNWAEHELATGWGCLPDEGALLDLEPLSRMQDLEYHIAQSEPRTILLARELLGICVTILAHQYENPEHTLSDGPVLEIVRNVVKSLEALSSRTPIGDAAREQCKRRKPHRPN